MLDLFKQKSYCRAAALLKSPARIVPRCEEGISASKVGTLVYSKRTLLPLDTKHSVTACCECRNIADFPCVGSALTNISAHTSDLMVARRRTLGTRCFRFTASAPRHTGRAALAWQTGIPSLHKAWQCWASLFTFLLHKNIERSTQCNIHRASPQYILS